MVGLGEVIVGVKGKIDFTDRKAEFVLYTAPVSRPKFLGRAIVYRIRTVAVVSDDSGGGVEIVDNFRHKERALDQLDIAIACCGCFAGDDNESARGVPG
jgi:hypothetical protein